MVADRVIADFFAEIFELKGEELATEDAARATHVKHWLDLDPAEKGVGKLLISRELLDVAIRKLKRREGSADGLVAEVCHAFHPQQEMF